MSEDKPDRFEEKARELLVKLSEIRSDASVKFWAQALREESKTQLVSESELEESIKIAKQGTLYDLTYAQGMTYDAELCAQVFEQGIRWAMKMRATMDLEKLWPTFEDAEKVILPTHGPFHEGFMACRLWILDWIKEKLGVK